MTVTQPEDRLIDNIVPETMLSGLAARAYAFDTRQQTTRELLTELGAAGLADLAVDTSRGTLVEQVTVCSFQHSLQTAERTGSSAMAPAFKYTAGLGDLGVYMCWELANMITPVRG